MVIVDTHTHIFPPELILNREDFLSQDATFRELYSNPHARMATAEDLINSMDRAEIDVSVAASIGWANLRLCQKANDYLIDAVRKYPDRLVGFCGVNPAWGEKAVEEIERCATAGFKGIGELHPYSQGYDLGDINVMQSVMDMAKKVRMATLVHSSEPVGHQYSGKGTTTPAVLERFINAFRL